jgi:uncharacterized repeat protein (TIGR01451 family)
MSYNPNAIWTSKKKTYGHPEESSPSVGEKGPEAELKKEPEQMPVASEPKPPRDGHSFFRRHGLAFFACGLLVLLAAALGIAFYLRPPAKPNVTISFSGSASVPVGVPTVITISSVNNSTMQLTGAVLTVVLPSGISFVGDDPSETAKEYPLGTIDPGAVAAQSSTIIVTGNPESLQRINVKLTYNTPNTAQTTFETDGESNMTIGDSAISVSYAAPQNIVSGQSFTFTVNYENNATTDADNVSFQATFPSVFTFATSSIPVSGNNTWNLGTIPAGTSGSFTVTGTIVGPAQAQYQMGGTISLDISGENYPINTQALAFLITQPALSLTITPNNSPTYISSAGDDLQYILNYSNNSNVSFASVNINANLVGQMFDFTSLQTSGAFSSRSDTITWSAANTPALASVAPGESGSVTFTIKTKTAFPIKLLSDKNYVLSVTGTIQSPTVPPNTAGSSTISVTTLQTKVGGAIDLAAVGTLQSGSYPPKVDQPTQYAIQWNIVNYSTDAENVSVSAYLQSGTTLVGAPTSNISSVPTYNPGTGLISWNIPAVPAGTGVVTQPIEAVLDVSNVPAVNQVGEDVTLLGASTLTATDSFTGEALQASADAVTTALPDDPSVSQLESHSVTQ